MKKKGYAIFLTQSDRDEELIKKSKLVKTAKYSAMMATTRGLNNAKQENQDYSAIVIHPRNEDFVMMLVADGRSESEDGKLASEMLACSLEKWFIRLPARISPLAFEHTFIKNLRRLNEYLYNEGLSETSFVLAIKCKDNTWIANIGNCRCYTVKDDEIKMQTEDDLVWYKFNDKDLINEDEIKYLVGKDYLEKTIGGSANKEQKFYPNIEIINNDYDKLVLTTHGITDVLDAKEIKAIVDSSDTEEAAKALVATSMLIDGKKAPKELIEKLYDINRNSFIRETVPGDSNATALVYKKTRSS